MFREALFIMIAFNVAQIQSAGSIFYLSDGSLKDPDIVITPREPPPTGTPFSQAHTSTTSTTTTESPSKDVFKLNIFSISGINEILQFKDEILEDPNKILSRENVIKRTQIWGNLEVLGFGGTWQRQSSRLVMGKFLQGIQGDLSSTTPKFSQIAAYKIAVKHIKRSNKFGKVQSVFPTDGNNSRFKLFVWIDPKDTTARLIYVFDILILREISEDTRRRISNVFVTIDGNTGKVIDSYEQLASATEENIMIQGKGGNKVQGSYMYGEGRWAGRLLNVTATDKNICRPDNAFATVASAAKHDFFFPPNQCFENQHNQIFEESCNPKSRNQDANDASHSQVHDALFLATKFQELLAYEFDDSSLKDCCGKVQLCVLFNDTGLAFFFKDSQCEAYFGRGDDKFVDMVSASTVGHELAHALITCTSRLALKCQPGAIGESFSDLCGIVLKASLDTYKTDWKFGSEITRTKGMSTAIRHMDNPTDDGHSIDHARNYNCGNIHHSAGIYNKAIYNLASKPSWTLQKTFQLFLRANKFYWTANIGFDQGLCGLLDAARDLGFRVGDVKQAFAKVGVFCGCPNGWLLRKETIQISDTIIDEHPRSSCFKVFNNKGSWIQAQEYCKLMKADLLVIDTEQTSNLIKQMLSGNQTINYWVGATDLISNDGTWQWAETGAPMTFTDWHPNEPNNTASRNCMLMRKANGIWGWNATKCHRKHGFICQLV